MQRRNQTRRLRLRRSRRRRNRPGWSRRRQHGTGAADCAQLCRRLSCMSSICKPAMLLAQPLLLAEASSADCHIALSVMLCLHPQERGEGCPATSAGRLCCSLAQQSSSCRRCTQISAAKRGPYSPSLSCQYPRVSHSMLPTVSEQHAESRKPTHLPQNCWSYASHDMFAIQ